MVSGNGILGRLIKYLGWKSPAIAFFIYTSDNRLPQTVLPTEAYVTPWNFFVKTCSRNFHDAIASCNMAAETLSAVSTSRMLFYLSWNCFGKLLGKVSQINHVTGCNFRQNLYRVAVSRQKFHRVTLAFYWVILGSCDEKTGCKEGKQESIAFLSGQHLRSYARDGSLRG